MRTINERYEDQVSASADAMLREDGGRSRVASPPPYMAQPGNVHRAIMKALGQVLTQGLTHPNVKQVPLPLRAAVRSMRRLEPMMLETLAQVPEHECITMMRQFADAVTYLADSVDPERHGRLTLVPAAPQSDQPATT